MKKLLRFDPLARLELREAFHFYEGKQVGLGKRLVAAVDSVCQKIKANPGSGRMAPYGMRRCSVPNFPYYVVFENQNDCIYIFAVAHAKRDLDYWLDRLPDT